MVSFVLGILGFSLYLIYDVNSYTVRLGIFRLCYALGTVLIGAAACIQLCAAWKDGCFSGAGDIILLLLGTGALAMLVYCLFFALPFSDTYVGSSSEQPVCDRGFYALCRHPGVLCFFFMFLFWGLAAYPAPLLLQGMVFSLLNLAYAWFQDRVTFPKTLSGYDEYRKRVPFLIPTKNSLDTAVRTLGRTDGKRKQP